MASFQAKPRWERPRMRLKKKKNYHSDPFQPDPELGISTK